MDKDRSHALSWVLEDAVIDLIACSKLYRECEGKGNDPFNNKYHLGLVRMCHSTAIVTLSKLSEAFNGFGKEINKCPDELVSRVRAIKIRIEKSGVYSFRSKYTAHVFDGKTKMPLDLHVGYKALTNIIGEEQSEVLQFYTWLFSPHETTNDVVSILVDLNDYISKYTVRETRY